MRLVKSLKQGQEKLESINAEFKGRVESTIRHWPEAINRKFAGMRNISLPWSQYLHAFDDSANDERSLLLEYEGLSTIHARLKQQLGQESYVGDWFTVTQDSIDRFASVTGDRQWIHTEPGRALAESPYKSTIAHGFLTLALIPMLTDSVDPDKAAYPEARMVVNYGMNRVRFPFPVREGKRIRARTRVIAVTPMRRCLEVVREVKIEIEHSTRPACMAEMVLRLYP